MNDNSFFSLDRLLEFGLSMEMARQMMSNINQSIGQMQAFGSQMPDGSSQSKVLSNLGSKFLYYVVIDGESCGPYNGIKLKQLIRDKKLTNKSFVWKPEFLEWKLAEKVPEILELVALTPPPVPN